MNNVRDYLPDDVLGVAIRELIRAGCHCSQRREQTALALRGYKRLQSRDHQACQYGLIACLIFGDPVKLEERTPKREENAILNWIK